MSRNLVSVFSCEAHRERNEAIRQTWGSLASKYADVRYFIGHPPDPLPDEVHLDDYGSGHESSGYENATYKMDRMFKWVYEQEYDGVLYCDSDTYVDPDALFQSDMTIFDCAGALAGGEHRDFLIGMPYYDTPFYGFLGAGGSIWMSRKALSYVVSELLKTASWGSGLEHSRLYGMGHWCADVWISQVLVPKYLDGSITMHHEPNCGDGSYTWHLGHLPRDESEKTRIPEVMREMHQKVKGDVR